MVVQAWSLSRKSNYIGTNIKLYGFSLTYLLFSELSLITFFFLLCWSDLFGHRWYDLDRGLRQVLRLNLGLGLRSLWGECLCIWLWLEINSNINTLIKETCWALISFFYFELSFDQHLFPFRFCASLCK